MGLGIKGRLVAVLLLGLGLGGCQIALPWQSDQAPAGVTAAPGTIAGGPISVTPITPGGQAKAPKPKPQAPETEGKPQGAGAGPQSPAAGAPQSPAPKPAAEPAPAPETPVPAKSASQLACEKQGGSWNRAGATITRTCVFRTRDGGKSCRRQSDCEGLCLARSRSCAPLRPLFGCNDILQNDGRQVKLCID